MRLIDGFRVVLAMMVCNTGIYGAHELLALFIMLLRSPNSSLLFVG